MVTGLVLGKFHPLHAGHIGLIRFAMERCDRLFVLVCASDRETIPGDTRLRWVLESVADLPGVQPVLLNYTEDELPNTSLSSRDVSKVWADKISVLLPEIGVIFSSERYGDYLAEMLQCQHLYYDRDRIKYPISATQLRSDLFKNWRFLAEAARPYFVKKICLYGTESTGKSTLTARLAAHFHTSFVPEMAREIIQVTDSCTEEQLFQIATLQAEAINEKVKKANGLLFVDTDINITRSYSRYLFGKELVVPDWIEQANRFDLYLYLDKDAPFVQDGTRLDKGRRDELDIFHRRQLSDRGIHFEQINGNWEERFEKSILIVKRYLSQVWKSE